MKVLDNSKYEVLIDGSAANSKLYRKYLVFKEVKTTPLVTEPGSTTTQDVSEEVTQAATQIVTEETAVSELATTTTSDDIKKIMG